MSKVTINSELFKDPRFTKLAELTGSELDAIGTFVMALFIAQRYWTTHRAIPKDKWNKYLDVLIEAGLAERKTNSDVYIKGSRNAFAWLDKWTSTNS